MNDICVHTNTHKPARKQYNTKIYVASSKKHILVEHLLAFCNCSNRQTKKPTANIYTHKTKCMHIQSHSAQFFFFNLFMFSRILPFMHFLVCFFDSFASGLCKNINIKLKSEKILYRSLYSALSEWHGAERVRTIMRNIRNRKRN